MTPNEWFFGLVVLMIVVIIIKGFFSNSASIPIVKSYNSSTMRDSSPQIKSADTIEKPSNWSYDTVKDEMTSGTVIMAKTEATNTFEFNAPYDGYNGAEIEIRRIRGVTDVILGIQKGQFIGGVEGQNIKVRFDQKRYSEYFCNPAADYDPTILFIDDTGDFIEHLKYAKQLRIEANIYDNGFQQFVFSVDGFKWGSSKKRKSKKNSHGGIDYGFVVSLPQNGKVPPKKKGYIALTGRNRNGHDTVLYIKGEE